MRAAVLTEYQQPLEIEGLAAPRLWPTGVRSSTRTPRSWAMATSDGSRPSESVSSNGGAWVPRLLDAFNRVYKKRPGEFDEHPVETFRRHVWINPFHEDDMGALVGMLARTACCSAPSSRTLKVSPIRHRSPTS